MLSNMQSSSSEASSSSSELVSSDEEAKKDAKKTEEKKKEVDNLINIYTVKPPTVDALPFRFIYLLKLHFSQASKWFISKHLQLATFV